VEKGDVLASMDKASFELRLAKAKKLLLVAQRRLEKVLSGSRAQEIEMGTIRVKSLTDIYLNKKRTYESKKRLESNNIVSGIELDGLYTDSLVALEEKKIAEQQLEILKQGARKEEIDLARSQVELAKADVDILQKELTDTILKAPFTGVIHDVHLEEGEFFTPAKAAFTLDDMTKVKIEISISQPFIHKLRKGESVEVKIQSLEEIYSGTIHHLSYKAHEVSKTFPGEIALKNPKWKIRAEMFAFVSFPLEEKERILLPPELVFQDSLGYYVWKILPSTKEEGKGLVARQTIRLGKMTQSQLPILGGLKTGDHIAYKGRHYLEEGEEVYWKP
jgi:RND family efflux transporter MFP subunit